VSDTETPSFDGATGTYDEATLTYDELATAAWPDEVVTAEAGHDDSHE